MLMEEQESLADLEADYREGNLSRARKKAFSQSFNLSRSVLSPGDRWMGNRR
jgi:Ca-activated chloride channel family protein